MPGNFKNNDLRIDKTLNAIQKAFLKLLESRSFGQITVNKLCEEAQISRRTFYLHFNDKYNLLKVCLTNISTEIRISLDDSNNYALAQRNVSQLVQENEKIISNLVKDANDETMDLLCTFMISFLNVGKKRDEDGRLNPQYIVLSNFCAGGMMKFLSWQVDNNFPQDIQLIINTHFKSLLIHISTWESGKNYNDGGKPPYDEP